MKFERFELYHVKLQMRVPFETSFGRFTERHLVISKVYSDIGVTYAEAPSLYGPFYSYETTYTVLHVLRDFIIPYIIDKEISTIQDLHKYMGFVRGHNIAKSAIDTAFYHLMSAYHGKPLSQYIGGVRERIDVGISIGVKSSLAKLKERVAWALDNGYKRIKIKIKPGWDLAPIRMIRQEFGDIPLMVDANSAYTLQDVDLFKEIDSYNLLMIEQPLAYDDIYEHSLLQREIQTPICLDESIESVSDAKLAVSIGACRVINIKLSRVGGIYPSIVIHDLCQRHNIPVWAGGMFESAIGKADSAALATLPNFLFPADIAPSDRYFVEDLVFQGLSMKDGTIYVPQGVGLGLDINEDFLNQACVAPPLVIDKRGV